MFNVYEAWAKLPVIDTDNLNIFDLIKVGNVLNLTASAWRYDFLAKEILCENHWESFDSHYRLLNGMNKPLAPLNMMPSDLVQGMVSDVHKEMKDYWKKRPPPTGVGP